MATHTYRLMPWAAALVITAATVGGCVGNDRDAAGYIPGTANDLRGTWDVIGTTGETIGEIQVYPGLFRARFGNRHEAELIFVETQGVAVTSWRNTRGGEGASIETTHIPQPVDLGMLPLDLGGVWTFERAGERCDATMLDGEASFSCDRVRFDRPPQPLPRGLKSGQAVRTSTAESIFGRLGGVWSVTGGGVERCSATFVGQTFTCECQREEDRSWADTWKIDGYVEVHFDGDIATGADDEGREFMAIRRR